MTTAQWLAIVLLAAVAGVFLERRRWMRGTSRNAVIVRDARLAHDRAFMAALYAIVEAAMRQRETE